MNRILIMAGLVLAAAGGTVAAAGRPLRVMTSFYPVYIATRNVVKDVPAVVLTNLTGPMTGCLHDYQMTTADMTRLAAADVFVVNGAGMEAFLEKVVQQLPRLRVIRASAGIALLPGPGAAGDNPHVWCSVSLYMTQVGNIAAGLARVDPPHAALYRRNAAVYVAKLERLRAAMQAGLANIATRDIVTFHEAFPYFAQEFGLHIVAVIEREPGAEPSARELAATIRTVRQTKVRVLFIEPQYPSKAAETIARETGARLATLDPVVTGPWTDDAYLEIMESNLRELEKALR